MAFLKDAVDPIDTLLMTDEYRAYKATDKTYNRAIINHQKSYTDGDIHTNTIEGFWSLIKRSWYGSHHHYSKTYMPLFVAETCWKYNHRKDDNAFSIFMKGCFS